MFRPLPNEKPSDFISRIAVAMEAAPLENATDDKWPRLYSCRFIEPGLVGYAEYGTVLVQKAALDKMAQSFVGKPVINLMHKEVSPKMYENGDADGVVSKVWFNEVDGWYWCEFIVWDEATKRNCESDAYSVSCAYSVSDINSNRGEYHNLPYEQEVLDGDYTHLAVVANPRYEGARIVYNSKGGTMKLFNWFKKGESKTAADLDKAVVDVDGKKVSVKELIEVHNSVEAAKAATSLENMSDETIIEVDGKEMPLKNLKDTYRSSLKNADDDEKKKKEKEDEERKNAEDEEKKKKEKDDEDRKNAEEKEDEEKKKKEKDMENSKHFDDLKNKAEHRGEPQKANIISRRELAEVGRQKYGLK